MDEPANRPRNSSTPDSFWVSVPCPLPGTADWYGFQAETAQPVVALLRDAPGGYSVEIWVRELADPGYVLSRVGSFTKVS